ncbi:Thymosin beta-4 [Pteropus alecto]|uniref:Thymosin beta-4 n=1 Tax=Pteropus alecto TaxID=9402 RepID=L5KJL8_PTEAL|nr:Thymosin beta-4 [Pteropus alecto]
MSDKLKMAEIENFNKLKSKKTKMQEKKPLPSKEMIEQRSKQMNRNEELSANMHSHVSSPALLCRLSSSVVALQRAPR